MTTVPQSHQDLLNVQVATLATLGPDGYPQVTALWFLLDEDGTVRLSLNSSRQKSKNLQKHPECTFFVIDPANPYRTLEMRARAEIEPDVEYAFAKKLSAKYGGVEFWTHDRPGEKRLVVSLHPVNVSIYG